MSTPAWAALRAAAAYEFRMQVRRPALWVGLPALGALTAWGLWGVVPLPVTEGIPAALADWALEMTFLLPVGVAALLADRLTRDRRLGVDQVLDALPAPPAARLYGKWAGSTAATLLPVALVYLLGAGYVAVRLGSGAALALAPVAFVAVALPGLLVVAAVSVPLPALMWGRAFQIGFIAVWFWATRLRPGVAGSPSSTFWDPSGWPVATRLFGARTTFTGLASPGQMAANLVFMAVLIVVPVLIVPRLLAVRAARA